MGRKRILFINCHLQAHNGNRVRRMEQWSRILREMVKGTTKDEEGNTVGLCCGGSAVVEPVDFSKNLEMKSRRDEDNELIDSRYQAIVWMGDFNSRIDIHWSCGRHLYQE